MVQISGPCGDSSEAEAEVQRLRWNPLGTWNLQAPYFYIKGSVGEVNYPDEYRHTRIGDVVMLKMQMSEHSNPKKSKEELVAQLVALLSANSDDALTDGVNRLLLRSVSYEALCTAWGMML